MNYYERHIGDYLKDTAHLSLLEHGVYGRLLDVYYTKEAPIPVAQVKRLIGVRTKDEEAALACVLEEFFNVDGELVRHSRCDREIERYKAKQEKASASANARWGKGDAAPKRNANAPKPHAPSDANAMRTHSERIANAVPTQCEGNAPSNQTPDTSNQYQRAPELIREGGPGGPAHAGFEKQPNAGAAAEAAQAMAAAGLAGVSAAHPKLRALVDAGMTVAELVAAAQAASAQGKEFPWALARAEGQRRDAAAMGALPAGAAAVDPDSKQAVEADGVRLGLGKWEQLLPGGQTQPWVAYAARVRQARAAERGEVVA